MLLNQLEYTLMNNPVRAAMQRRVDAQRLVRLGGRMRGGAALELGCGRGVGAELILDVFGAERVDAFDLDRRMITRAQSRLRGRHATVRLWIADVTLIPVPSATYDAVFDFGILHHVPDWRRALAEVARVLKPGGRFYAMEVLQAVIVHPLVRWLLTHPQVDRFDEPELTAALRGAGLRPVASQTFSRAFAWVVADRQAAASHAWTRRAVRKAERLCACRDR